MMKAFNVFISIFKFVRVYVCVCVCLSDVSKRIHWGLSAQRDDYYDNDDNDDDDVSVACAPVRMRFVMFIVSVDDVTNVPACCVRLHTCARA